MYKIIEFHITLITSLFIFHIAKSLLSYREGNLISEMRKLNENAYEENVQERNEERKVEEQKQLKKEEAAKKKKDDYYKKNPVSIISLHKRVREIEEGTNYKNE